MRASLQPWAAACAVFLSGAAGMPAAEPSAGRETAVAPASVVPLFNGRDLAGWSSWLVDSGHADPRGVFAVTNGMIRVSGDGLGYLATRQRFRDYRLVVEFRWGGTNTAWGDRIGHARDSGIFLHATGPDGNSHDGGGAFRSAIECNLFEGATGDFLLIRGNASDGTLVAPRVTAEAAPVPDADGWPTWRRGGAPRRIERWGRVNWAGKSEGWRDVTGFRGAHDLERPAGEWNRVECECRGEAIRVRVNGKEANAVTGAWPSAGAILLQCEGSEVHFRRVELHPPGGKVDTGGSPPRRW